MMTNESVSVLEALPTVAAVLGDEMDRAETHPLGDGLSAHVIKRPGAALTRTAHNRIYEALIPVTTSSFGADMTLYWAQRGKEGYLERLAEFVLVEGAGGAIVGWTGFHVLPYGDRTLIYLDSTGMVPTQQSRGVMRELMRDRVHGSGIPSCPAGRPVHITARSESPVFYRLMRGLLDGATLYPDSETPPPSDILESARLLAGWLGQTDLLNEETLALQNAYSNLDELYGELPTTGDAALDTLFRERLGPLDAYLLVGRVALSG